MAWNTAQNIILVNLGHLSQLYAPPSLLSTPSHTHGMGRARNQVLSLYKHCSTGAKTLVFSALVTNTKFGIIQAAANLTPQQPDPEHFLNIPFHCQL